MLSPEILPLIVERTSLGGGEVSSGKNGENGVQDDKEDGVEGCAECGELCGVVAGDEESMGESE